MERSSGAAPPRPSGGSGGTSSETDHDLLHVEVERGDDGHSVVALTGELDLSTIPRLEKPLFDELAASDAVIVDLTRLSFIDSSGIGVLIKAHRAGQPAGAIRLVISRGSQVERVFAVAGIDRALKLSFSRDEVLASLNGAADGA